MQTLISSFLLILLLFLSSQCNAGAMETKAREESLKMELETMEMEMDSERRMIWGNNKNNNNNPKRYISYEALRGDAVPCSKPGVPYYNCESMPRANPYTRGCEIITLCARDFSP
ncbi:hypothetical protein LUZ60_008001 [Juncus effusus]|nr:hypothetical protein LUZ60_008001 [Juncus effusus]